jgi:diguanylate cyclase (GGDEF)-like protein
MHPDRLRDEEGRLAALRRYDLTGVAGDAPIQSVVDLVREILAVPAAAVTLLDAEREWVKAARGFGAEVIVRRDSFCAETIRQYDAMRVPDALDDWRFAGNPMVRGAPHLRSYLGVPLTTSDGYNIGSLCVFDSEPRDFDDREVGIVKKFAQLVIEQFEVEQVAKLDAATEALTRRGFLAEIEKEFVRAHRYDRPSSLVVIDIDNFRATNEQYGHPAGDALLVAIAKTCASTMRQSDIFGRIGGDEFGLLLPETDAEEALAAGERLRRAIEAGRVETSAGPIKATASLGIAPIPALSEGWSSWLAEADIALSEAKQSGRNRVVAGKARRPAPIATDLEHQARRPH